MSEHHVTTESRKVVTVLFSDIQGSTRLGEVLDPESLRDMMSRYFSEVRSIIERHEGVVEKFIGDAVMAVFGLPNVHEDDALRAVRAADEVRTRLAALNDEFTAIWGVTVSVRTGINTGEILARERPRGESIVLGDAVNVAARLEQEAEPGEILIGDATYRLVHDAVTAEDTGPLTLKGKAAPVPAWRLLRVAAHAPGWSRRLDSPLVGRRRELAELERAFGRAADHRTCELVTVMGPAGLSVSDLSGARLAEIPAGELWRVAPGSTGVVALAPGGARTAPSEVIELSSPDSLALVQVNGRPYRGTITALRDRTGITVVDRLPMEAYLAGVVSAEMGRRAPQEQEALRAQAVVSRTFALRNLGRWAAQGFDLYASVADQVYGGAASETPEGRVAVEATRGRVLTYGGAPIDAFFYSTCGGRTADGPEVFRAADADSDGRLSVIEYMNERFKEFSDADRNRDGVLTQMELDGTAGFVLFRWR